MPSAHACPGTLMCQTIDLPKGALHNYITFVQSFLCHKTITRSGPSCRKTNKQSCQALSLSLSVHVFGARGSNVEPRSWLPWLQDPCQLGMCFATASRSTKTEALSKNDPLHRSAMSQIARNVNDTDGRNSAPPEKPWDDDVLVNRQTMVVYGFKVVRRYFVHPQYG